MLSYLAIGILFGVTAGFSPGPLLTLVISETLEHGVGAGIRVALAPIITDIPIIAVTLLVFTQLSDFDTILGTISLLGGCYVLYIGYESISAKAHNNRPTEERPKSLTRGVLANALSPHPYLFWFSVGAPTTAKAMSINTIAPLLFIGGFYLLLIGSKVGLALIVGRSKTFLNDRTYGYTMKLLGLALVAFSFVLFADGLKLLHLLGS